MSVNPGRPAAPVVSLHPTTWADVGVESPPGATGETATLRPRCVYCNTVTDAPSVVLQGHPNIVVCQPCHEHLKSATPVQRFALALQGIEHTMRDFFDMFPLPPAAKQQLLREALDDAEGDLWAHIVEGRPLQRHAKPSPNKKPARRPA
jgi:hypothetical protein